MPSEKSNLSKSKANEHRQWIFPRLMKVCITTAFYIRIKLFLLTSQNPQLKHTSLKPSNATGCTQDSSHHSVIYSPFTSCSKKKQQLMFSCLRYLYKQIKDTVYRIVPCQKNRTYLTIYVENKQINWDHDLPFVLHSGTRHFRLNNQRLVICIQLMLATMIAPDLSFSPLPLFPSQMT